MKPHTDVTVYSEHGNGNDPEGHSTHQQPASRALALQAS
jgi:hypothetical protein